MGNTAIRQQGASTVPAGRVHPLMLVTVVAFLLPVSWDIGSLFMTPMRTLYVFTVPVLGIIWLRGGMGPKLIGDWLLIAYLVWMAMSVGKNHPSQLVTFTASTGLTILGGYLTARYTVRSTADFMALSRLLAAIVIVLLLPLGLYESITHAKPLVTDLLSGLGFIDTYRPSMYCCRLGLARAQTVFVHPIHHGIACSIPFALYFMSTANHIGFVRRAVVASLIGLATFTSVSSGAVLAVGFMGALILYAITFESHPKQWRMFLWGVVIVYVILELNTTKFAIFTLSEKLAFSNWNVYIRGLLYNAGVDQIMKTPILGFGYNRLPQLPHWMTGSMDNYWLQQAVSHGLLGFVLPFTAFLYAILRSGRNGFTKGSDLYNVRLAYGFTLTALTLSMTTVAVWAEVQSMIFMALGMGQFLFTAQEDDTPVAAATVQRPSAPVYTRFPAGAGQPGGAAALPRRQVLSRASGAGKREAFAGVSKRRPNRIIGPSNTR
ncbi:O-antigen ligase family protein [Meridianimarinicoccus sp. RP-17]|uniref:O-antigen ligase family protein n=1 Tax=Meridianimarinicoccus zhengii TaxID=2056810 RepID=UPI0013A69852|nr:O-antigen ligase family protein [Phycocomes zhengii]